MTRRRSLCAGLAFVPTVAGASPRIPVVATFTVLADMTRKVGGNLVSVTSLVPADGDAHVYEPTTKDSREIAAAAMLIENGLGLEGWMSRLGDASGFRGVRIVASVGITPRLMLEGKVTSVDPHAWQDPRNGVIYARNIANGLATADPVHADIYHTNALSYIAALQQADNWIASQFAPVPLAARRIITTHDAFGYYGERYGIKFLAVEGLSTDSEPSAKAISELVAEIKREQARAVFLENMTDPRLTDTVAKETGAALAGPLYSDALSPPGGPAPDYVTMLRYNTTLFVRALRPG